MKSLRANSLVLTKTPVSTLSATSTMKHLLTKLPSTHQLSTTADSGKLPLSALRSTVKLFTATGTRQSLIREQPSVSSTMPSWKLSTGKSPGRNTILNRKVGYSLITFKIRNSPPLKLVLAVRVGRKGSLFILGIWVSLRLSRGISTFSTTS